MANLDTWGVLFGRGDGRPHGSGSVVKKRRKKALFYIGLPSARQHLSPDNDIVRPSLPADYL